MAKIKHTPSPWKVKKWEEDGLADGFKTVITDSRGHGIAELFQFGKNEKAEANSRIISKSPEMLEYLEHVLKLARKMGWSEERNIIINRIEQLRI